MRMAARGRTQVRRQFSWDRTVSAIERVYARAQAERGER
jgi:hypothetical protein